MTPLLKILAALCLILLWGTAPAEEGGGDLFGPSDGNEEKEDGAPVFGGGDEGFGAIEEDENSEGKPAVAQVPAQPSPVD
jgi:hypothetical protein